MGRKNRRVAVLDACVLFPIAVCDALLSVADTELFDPKWSARIDDEWMRALQHRYGFASDIVSIRRAAMRKAFPDWEVPAARWQPCDTERGLPDPGDRHVVAAAVASHAECIVTHNLKHFPPHVLAPLGIVAMHPDTFLVELWDVDPVAVRAAFDAMRSRRRRPALSPAGFADTLERNGLPAVARRLRQGAETA